MKSFLDSLLFNAIMSVVSVVVLGEKLFTGYLSGDFNFIMIIIWMVIAFHYIATSIKTINKKDET